MPTLIIALVTGVVFIVSVLFSQHSFLPKTTPVISPSPVLTREIATPESEPTSIPTLIPTPISTPTLFLSSTPTSYPASLADNVSQLVYPGSLQISNDNQTQVYETSTDAQTVGKWYKDLLKNSSFSIKNYVSTATNGAINITISLAKAEGKSLNISVKQNPGSPTRITLSE